MRSFLIEAKAVPARVLVAGAGSIGLRHARLWRELTGVEVGICDPTGSTLEAARQELAGIQTWSNFSDALALGPEVVVVATPHSSHAELTCQSLESGADVLCEKPMSMDSASSQEMQIAAEKTGRTLRVGFVNRFHPGLKKLKEMWSAGVLGQALHIQYTVGAYETLPNSRSRYQSKLPGSLVMDYVHGLDLILWLGEMSPAGIYARGVEGGTFPLSSSPNLCNAILDYPTPFLAGIHLDYAVGPTRASIEVIGDKASAGSGLLNGSFWLRERESGTAIEESLPFDRDDMFREQIQDFLLSRSGGKSIGCTPAEGCVSTELMEVFLQSLKEQRRIPFRQQYETHE